MNTIRKFFKFNLSHMACFFISVIILVGCVVYVALPWLVDWYIDNTAVEISASTHKVMISMLYSIGVPIFITLVMLWLLTLNISRGKSFITKNVTYLRAISVCSVVIAVMGSFPLSLPLYSCCWRCSRRFSPICSRRPSNIKKKMT